MPSAARRRQPAPRDTSASRPTPIDPALLQARRVRIAVASTIAVIAAVLYFRMVATEHELLQLEDYRYLVNNPLAREGFSSDSLKQVPTAIVAGNWHPATLFTHLLDVQVFGSRTAGHHATSLLLHAANAGLLCYVLARMTGSIWPSALAAALFACHPLAVEPVAWVSARKDVLSGLFWMLTMCAYVAYVEQPRFWRYALVLLALAAGLMSKPMLVTLPCVLLLLDFWPLARLRASEWRKTAGSLVREKLPLFALVWLSCVITLWVHWTHKSTGTMGWGTRISLAVQTYYVYLREAVWPASLYVPHHTPTQAQVNWPVIGLGLLGLIAITAGSLWAARKRPYLTVGWLWYLGTLVPVLGFVQIGIEPYPDRYAYLPLIGIYIAVAWALDELASRSVALRRAATAGAAIVVVALVVTSFLQLGRWQNTISLFEHTVKHSPDNYLARALLGNGYYLAKRYDDALEQFDQAVKILPVFPSAYYNRGQVLLARGNEPQKDFDEAHKAFDTALRLGYDRHDSLVGMAASALRLRHYDEAEQFARQALDLRTDSLPALIVLAGVASARNDAPMAVQLYRRALDIMPDQPSLLISLARIYATCEDDAVRQGIAALEMAQRANTLTQYKDPYMIDTLAAAFAERGQYTEAQEAVGWGLQMAEAMPNQEDPQLRQTVADLEAHLELYRAKLPLREPINVHEPVVP